VAVGGADIDAFAIAAVITGGASIAAGAAVCGIVCGINTGGIAAGLSGTTSAVAGSAVAVSCADISACAAATT
jgi:hypothetical protein